jgi:hypothetical protein
MNAVIHHRAADRADEWQGLYGKQQHRKVMGFCLKLPWHAGKPR